jgi:hypothetical protein
MVSWPGHSYKQSPNVLKKNTGSAEDHGVKMLIIRCAACKTKLWKYDKIGPGEVLRCHKARIGQKYNFTALDQKIQCTCGKDIGIDKGPFIKMISKAFTYSGTKRNC